MKLLLIVLVLAIVACSGTDRTVVPSGDPSVSKELRDRKGEPIVPIIKGDKELKFFAEHIGDRPVPEEGEIITLTSIDLSDEHVVVSGNNKSFEIIINQSKLLKETKKHINIGDEILIRKLAWKKKIRYFIKFNFRNGFLFAEWVK